MKERESRSAHDHGNRFAAAMKTAASCLVLLAAVFLSALAVPGTALAEQKVFTAGSSTDTDHTVLSRTSKNNQILSVPGSWDITRMHISFAGRDEIVIGKNNPPVSYDSEVDLSRYLGTRVPVYTGGGTLISYLTVYHGSDIPCLFFEVDSAEFSAINRSKDNVITEGTVRVQEADGEISFDGELAHLKCRGNDTFLYSKKPYEFKLKKKTAIGGMPKGKTWILLANYRDSSLLRNQLVLDLSLEAGLPFAIHCEQTDVWVNGQYQGVYLMTEKIQISRERINIRDLEEETEKVNDEALSSYPAFDLKKGPLPIMCGFEIPNDPEDITGGYIAVIEKPHRLNKFRRPGIRTEGLLNVRIKEPTCPSLAQVMYFGARVNDMHNATIAGDGINPDTGMHYTEYLDIVSFSKKFLIEDLSKNYDGVAGSQYLFKDSDTVDPLFYAGPSGDYDLCFGNVKTRGLSSEGDYIARVKVGPANLYSQLAAHDDFMESVSEQWRNSLRPALAVVLGEEPAGENCSVRPMEEYVSRLKDSAAMNQARWGQTTRAYSSAGKTFDSGTAYLERWLRNRVAYMDGRYADQNENASTDEGGKEQ